MAAEAPRVLQEVTEVLALSESWRCAGTSVGLVYVNPDGTVTQLSVNGT